MNKANMITMKVVVNKNIRSAGQGESALSKN